MKFHGHPTSVEVPGAAGGVPPWFCRVYVLLVFLVGSLVLAWSIQALVAGIGGHGWIALAVLTVIAGSFALKVPRVPATVSLSEVFVFATILSFGAAPAVVTVAIDGLITSVRRRNRRLHRLLFNVTEPAISVWVASEAFTYVSGFAPLSVTSVPLPHLLLPVLTMSAVYFLLNSGLTALAVMSEGGGSPYRIWRTHFAWLSLNYFGSASIALLLAMNAKEITVGTLFVTLPLLGLLYVAFKSRIRGIEDSNEHLAQLNRSHVATVESLAMAVDARDQITHGHIRRVQAYTQALARRMGIDDESQLKALEVAALLHDTGKIAVPDHILNKPGRLTPAEYDRMKHHTVIGAGILSAVDFPYPVVPIVRHHHECWDGTGYPDGLRGTAIPIGARILSVIDCYDALTSDRPYRRALDEADAVAIIRQRRGSMYDPAVVDAFLSILPDLPRIATDEPPTFQETSIRRHVAAPVEPTPRSWPVDVVPATASVAEVLAIGELSDLLGGRASLEDSAELMARHVRRLTPASLVVFYLVDEASERLTVAHASGAHEHLVRDLRLRLGHGLSGWVVATRSTMLNADPALDLGDCLDLMSPRLESALSAPLVTEQAVVGAMTLYAPGKERFTAADARSVELVRRSIASALTLARRTDTRTTALVDAATGLPNRLYLDTLVNSEGWLERTRVRSRAAMSIRLPQVTTETRPELLAQVVELLRQALRGEDLLFRPEPEEILVLIAEARADAMSRIRDRIEARFGELAALPGGSVAVGMACAETDASSWERLIAEARLRRDALGDDGRHVVQATA